jgi:hypothetical protein
MKGRTVHRHAQVRRPAGQIIVVAALAMVSIVAGVALVLEAGNAYAHQRATQNASDAVANAGAAVIAERLGGIAKTDGQVAGAMGNVSAANGLGTYTGYYTDIAGDFLSAAGTIVGGRGGAALVGGGVIPPGAQGVHVDGSLTFGTTFANVLGFPHFTASADAIAVAGALAGGGIMPIVFPVNIVDCETNGDLGTGEVHWQVSNPDGPDADKHPEGQEYIVPLCKTGGGSFMVLDLDGTMNNCDAEVAHPPATQFARFPVQVDSDNGNNCAKRMVDEVNARAGQVVLIPICDGACTTTGGSHAEYHIVRVTAFVIDYMSDQNGGQNPACEGNGTTLIPIAGNGSSSCLAGWFVRYITSGPVGAGPILGAGAVGIQLVK